MKKPALLIALMLSTASCGQVLSPQARYDPGVAGSVDQAMCRLGFTAIPMRELMTGHHLVDVVIDGKPAAFIVDTGANLTVMNAGDAATFGLQSKPVALAGAFGIGGAVDRAGQAGVRSMAVGGMPVRQTRVMTADLGQVVDLVSKLAGRRVAGIVGQDVMREHRAVIDVARPILYMVPGDGEPKPVDPARCDGGTNAAAR